MSPREQTCTRDDARARIADARSMMVVADLVVNDDMLWESPPGGGRILRTDEPISDQRLFM